MVFLNTKLIIHKNIEKTFGDFEDFEDLESFCLTGDFFFLGEDLGFGTAFDFPF